MSVARGWWHVYYCLLYWVILLQHRLDYFYIIYLSIYLYKKGLHNFSESWFFLNWFYVCNFFILWYCIMTWWLVVVMDLSKHFTKKRILFLLHSSVTPTLSDVCSRKWSNRSRCSRGKMGPEQSAVFWEVPFVSASAHQLVCYSVVGISNWLNYDTQHYFGEFGNHWHCNLFPGI